MTESMDNLELLVENMPKRQKMIGLCLMGLDEWIKAFKSVYDDKSLIEPIELLKENLQSLQISGAHEILLINNIYDNMLKDMNDDTKKNS